MTIIFCSSTNMFNFKTIIQFEKIIKRAEK
jgi:hypothetical protein